MGDKQLDFYLNPDNVYNRLLEEYLKYGRIIIACDFDDTLSDYHHRGTTYDYVTELLRRWKDNAEIIVTSCVDEGDDARIQLIKDYMKENDIPYNKINAQSKYSPTPKAAKIYYNVLLDDRAGLRECYDVLLKLIIFIESGAIGEPGKAN